jgi:predicted nucleic acid-binding protein
LAIRTYLDSNVLINAYKGLPNIKLKARTILLDPDREFVSSIFVRLETLPVARFIAGHQEEIFYNTFFASVSEWLNPPIFEQTFILASNFSENTGMSGIDALHIAAATQLGSNEFITAERSTRAMFRASNQAMKIISITP